MFYFQLNKIKILRNRELFKAEVKLMSFVTADNVLLPELDEFISTNDSEKKKLLIETAVKRTVGAHIFTTIPKVKDKQEISFGQGKTLFQSEKIPEQLNWQFLAFEDDNRIRDNASLALKIVQDNSFSSLLNSAVEISKLANPAFLLGTEIAKYVAKTSLKIFAQNKDDLLGVLETSLIRQKDFPNGNFNAQNIPDETGNIFLDYSIFSNQ